MNGRRLYEICQEGHLCAAIDGGGERPAAGLAAVRQQCDSRRRVAVSPPDGGVPLGWVFYIRS